MVKVRGTIYEVRILNNGVIRKLGWDGR